MIEQPSREITVKKADQLPENTGQNMVAEALSGVLNKAAYRLGLVTREREVLSPDHENGKVGPSSLPARFDRAQMYHKVQAERKFRKDNPASTDVVIPYKKLQTIEREFQDQKALEITHPEYGNITACYALLNREASPQNPLFVISGASNSVESMDSFARELAAKQSKRRVYILAYPDSASGVITQKFHDAVYNSKGFEPHSEIFKEMIKHLHPQGDFEVWGYSAGGAIVPTILARDQEMSDRVTNVALLFPHGATVQSKKEFEGGAVKNSLGLMSRLKNILKLTFINDPSTGDLKKLKFDTWMNLAAKGQTPVIQYLLNQIHLRDSAKLLILSGENDHLTKSAQTFNAETAAQWKAVQKSLVIDVLPGSGHEDLQLRPEDVVFETLYKLGDSITS